METIFWAVVLYFVAKRWLKKHPEKADMLKSILNEKMDPRTTGAVKKEAPRIQPSPILTTAKHPRVTGASHTAAKFSKKREKQFQEL